MPKKKESGSEVAPRKRRPALTVEARENQMISLAIDLAEKQLREGTASAQVITHYLKLGTMKEKLERENLIEDNKLKRAKTEAIARNEKIEELYADAIKAMSLYSGHSRREDYDDEEDDDYDYKERYTS